MLDFLKTSRKKDIDKQLKAIDESNQKIDRSLNECLFLITITPDVIWISATLDDCRDYLQHLLDWQTYSLSEAELEQIRSRGEEIADLNVKFGQVLERAKSSKDNASAISDSLEEIKKLVKKQKTFCQELIERLKVQNSLMTRFFPEKSITLSWK